MKESARAVSKTIRDSGVVCEDKRLVSDVDHPERNLKRPHRVEGWGTRIGHVVRDIHHDESSRKARELLVRSLGEGERETSFDDW
jgi:hypothetical protein